MSCFSSSFLYFYVGNIFFNCIYPIFLHPIWIIHQKEDVFIEMHEAGAADGRAKHKWGTFSRWGTSLGQDSRTKPSPAVLLY